MRSRPSVALALFGALCVVTAVLVLSGVRDGTWSVLSWLIPIGLVAAGGAALAGVVGRRS